MMAGFEGLQSDFSSRLQELMNAAPAPFSVASGFRSVERQQQLFNQAVAKYGSADAARKWVAPPGKSNHNKGIAADLQFPNEFVRRWVHANAARFGLVFPMQHEPWHIEPLGGRDIDVDAYTIPPEIVEGPADRIANGMQSLITMMAEGMNVPPDELLGSVEEADLDIDPLIDQSRFEEDTALLDDPGDLLPTRPRGPADLGPEAVREFKASGDRLSARQIAEAAKNAGFTGQALVTAVAIAMGESSGNARAHNPNANTGDNSYGLWQINMLGGMGPERRQRFGINSNEQLFNPLTNARAAYGLSSGGKDFTPWTVFTKGRYRRFVGAARAAVQELQGQEATRARRRAV